LRELEAGSINRSRHRGHGEERGMKMKLWLLKRTDGIDYDEYDSDVVAAKTGKRAKELSNVGRRPNITIKCIGTASARIKEGVVIGSFNAG